MIPRYSRPDMVAIWSPETKFRIWYEIEAHACDAQADLGVIPRANAEAVWKAKDVTFDVARIDEIEAVTKHDVIAFTEGMDVVALADADGRERCGTHGCNPCYRAARAISRRGGKVRIQTGPDRPG